MIDSMEGDGWVVKLMDSVLLDHFLVGGSPDQPTIILFRSGLPVIYDG